MVTIATFPAGRDKRGFSLLELLIVLVLLAIGLTIVVPSIEQGLKHREVRRSALAVAALARNLRSRAIYDGTLQGLVLYPVENTIQPSAGKRILLSDDIKIFGIAGGEPVGSGGRQFLFFPNGSTAGGEIGISGPRGFGYTVRLQPLTGKVDVLRREN